MEMEALPLEAEMLLSSDPCFPTTWQVGNLGIAFVKNALLKGSLKLRLVAP